MVNNINRNLGWERVCWQAERYEGREVGCYNTCQCKSETLLGSWI